MTEYRATLKFDASADARAFHTALKALDKDPSIDGRPNGWTEVAWLTDDRDHDVREAEQAMEAGVATCGVCGRSFPDIYPAARCPYEYEHAVSDDNTVRLTVTVRTTGDATQRADLADYLRDVGRDITSRIDHAPRSRANGVTGAEYTVH